MILDQSLQNMFKPKHEVGNDKLFWKWNVEKIKIIDINTRNQVKSVRKFTRI